VTAGTGPLIALLLPFGTAFMIVSTLCFLAWYLLGSPRGNRHRRRLGMTAANPPAAGGTP
jgi:p-aminobenzoyl-glutamate transporter AbgT